jgi:hypothetical protein
MPDFRGVAVLRKFVKLFAVTEERLIIAFQELTVDITHIFIQGGWYLCITCIEHDIPVKAERFEESSFVLVYFGYGKQLPHYRNFRSKGIALKRADAEPQQ